MLSDGQKAHFGTFGFLVFRGLFSQNEMDEIGREADDVLAEDRGGKPFAGDKRQAVFAFVEQRPLLAGLAEDDRIYRPIEELLGPGFMWGGSDGNLYVGDTHWHSDSRPDPIEYGYTRIKVALYLDPVTKDTGCLRVIPGSHRPPLHEALEPLRHLRKAQSDYAGKTESKAEQQAEGPERELSETPLGVPSAELPGFPLESQPGDVAFFNQRLWHSSFGGKTGRRMFTLNYGEKPVTEDQVKLVKMVYESSLASSLRRHTQTKQHYTDSLYDSDRPRVQAMMAVPKELGLR